MDKKNIVLPVLRRWRENPNSLIGKVLSAAGAAGMEQVINELTEMMAEAVAVLMSSADGDADGATCVEEPVGLAEENAPKQAAAGRIVSMPVFSTPTSTLSVAIPDSGRWYGGEKAGEEQSLFGQNPVDKTGKEVDYREETASFSEADFANTKREETSRIPEVISVGDETEKASEDETRKASGDETRKASGDETRKASGDETRKASGDETGKASEALSGEDTAANSPEPLPTARMESDIQNFLTRHYDLRFNVLTEVTEYRPKNSGAFTPVDKRALNAICMHVHRAGIGCWDSDVMRVVESRGVADHHPFQHYFSTLPAWDGRDRLRDLAARVSADAQWQAHFHRWMLGVAAQWAGLNDGLHAQSVAPLLVSAEQGLGKSTFCRALMPPELSAYYTDSVNLARPETVERHLVEMGLINLDEFDRIPESRQPQLKNIMQLSALNMRRAYKKNACRLPRVASFIGTSNSRELLTDPTGSRRFICVEVDGPIRTDGIDHAQVYAQLKAELEAGERHWFSKAEEAEIQRANLSFYRVSPATEVLRHCFRVPGRDEQGELLSLPEIHAVMRRRCPGAAEELKLRTLSRALVAAGVRKVHTADGNRYRVIRN